MTDTTAKKSITPILCGLTPIKQLMRECDRVFRTHPACFLNTHVAFNLQATTYWGDRVTIQLVCAIVLLSRLDYGNGVLEVFRGCTDATIVSSSCSCIPILVTIWSRSIAWCRRWKILTSRVFEMELLAITYSTCIITSNLIHCIFLFCLFEIQPQGCSVQ